MVFLFVEVPFGATMHAAWFLWANALLILYALITTVAIFSLPEVVMYNDLFI